jgi:DNA-binding MarR family transcriptional regulator
MKRRPKEETDPIGTARTPQEQAYIELLQTARVAERWALDAMKPTGLTPSQFNVLRILRGARPEKLSCTTISERMVHHDPDVTRLLDRLERSGWIEKARDTRDRRVVMVGITPAGVEVIESASAVVRDCLKTGLAPLGERDLATLIQLLQRARAQSIPDAAATISQTTKPRTATRRRVP